MLRSSPRDGDGKEVVARQIHACRRAPPKPLIPSIAQRSRELMEAELLATRAAPSPAPQRYDGQLMAAAGGTVFLDRSTTRRSKRSGCCACRGPCREPARRERVARGRFPSSPPPIAILRRSSTLASSAPTCTSGSQSSRFTWRRYENDSRIFLSSRTTSWRASRKSRGALPWAA